MAYGASYLYWVLTAPLIHTCTRLFVCFGNCASVRTSGLCIRSNMHTSWAILSRPLHPFSIALVAISSNALQSSRKSLKCCAIFSLHPGSFSRIHLLPRAAARTWLGMPKYVAWALKPAQCLCFAFSAAQIVRLGNAHRVEDALAGCNLVEQVVGITA